MDVLDMLAATAPEDGDPFAWDDYWQQTSRARTAAIAEIKRLREERDQMAAALAEIEAIDLQWADGLDANVERIKTVARKALAASGDGPGQTDCRAVTAVPTHDPEATPTGPSPEAEKNDK